LISFAGYKEVLNNIYNQVREKNNSEILNIGFGTGILTIQLYKVGCQLQVLISQRK
jgi:putative AdoMet-dependent methyltransferase